MIGNIAAGLLGAPYSAPVGPPVSGYKLWLDASDTSTITASGGSVSQWSDKSGFNRNFTQGTGANQPTTGTRTINSKNVIDFDGINDSLTCASSTNLFNYLHNSTGGTTFVVCSIDAFGASSAIFSNNAGTSGQVGVYEAARSAGTGNVNFITNGSSPAPVFMLNSITFSTSTPFYLTTKWDGGNATANQRCLVSLSGGAFAGNNANTSGVSSSDAGQSMSLNPDADYDGVIGEVIFYEGILSAGDITSVNSYLATKWGI